MKDAFGGSFILRIMLVFFVIFICFMTVAINFAKTFQIKNSVINILERTNYNKLDSAKESIDEYLRKISYSYPASKYNNVVQNCSSNGGELTERGVCIVSHFNQNNNSVYYKVIVYIVMDFPLFHLGGVIPVSGESKILYQNDWLDQVVIL